MPATPAPITTTRGGSKGGCATFLRFLVLPQVCALWAPWQARHVEGGGATLAARGGGPPMANLFGGADVALPEVKPFFWRPPCFFAGGAPFDPFGLSVGDAAFYETQRVAEIKHGRLAMVAMAGVFAQAAATGAGPVENLRNALAFAS